MTAGHLWRPLICWNSATQATSAITTSIASRSCWVVSDNPTMSPVDGHRPLDEIEILQLARTLVQHFGNHAEAEVNRRAELALLRDDMDDFDLWARVVVFVSDLNSRRPR